MVDENRKYWNQQFKILQDKWPKPDDFDGCIRICLNLHAMVHTQEVNHFGTVSFEDELWTKLSEEEFRRIHKDEAIAWKLWHSARIEDITMNVLIAGESQLFNTDRWQKRLKIDFIDTGNAMNEAELEALCKTIDKQALWEYRLAVGTNTQRIIKSLEPQDLKGKVDPAGLQKLFNEGAVAAGAKWLVDYWGKKTVAGLLLMPATRHNLVHLNESMRLLGKKRLKEL